ncbi:MAG: nitroreductase family protein [Polyangiales bacterium]
MNVLETIAARRAVRSYLPRPVSEETVRSLLRAAVQAPSAMNAQPWVFGVVQSPAILKQWSDRAKAAMLANPAHDPHVAHLEALLRSEDFNIFYDATTLVVIGARSRGRYTEADCWLAAQNLMLAACDAGLGTCPIGFATSILDTKDVKETLGFGADGVAVAALIVGYPREKAPPVPRNEPAIGAWIRGD